jgi:hypothetical protein
MKTTPPPRLFVIRFIPIEGSASLGVKFLTGVAKIVATRVQDSKKPAVIAAGILGKLREETEFDICVLPKDLAESVATHLASRLAGWAEKCSKPITSSPFFQIEVIHAK